MKIEIKDEIIIIAEDEAERRDIKRLSTVRLDKAKDITDYEGTIIGITYKMEESSDV